MEKNITSDEKVKLDELQKKLAVYQQNLKKNKIPVIIILEGWGASGKGNVISGIIKELDPRGFKVYTTGEKRRNFPLCAGSGLKSLYMEISQFLTAHGTAMYQSLLLKRVFPKRKLSIGFGIYPLWKKCSPTTDI